MLPAKETDEAEYVEAGRGRPEWPLASSAKGEVGGERGS